MTAVVMQKKDFSWNANFNISFNHNNIDRITNLQNSYLDNSGSLTGQPHDFIVKVGSPVGAMYGFVTQGMYQVSDFNAVLNTSTGRYVYTLKPGVADNSTVAGVVAPGTVKFKDISGPGGKPGWYNIDANNDRTIIGNAPNPSLQEALTRPLPTRGSTQAYS